MSSYLSLPGDYAIITQSISNLSNVSSYQIVENIDFEGESRIKVLLDEVKFEIKLNSSGKTILDAINKEGYDAPYSCRGGVCCTCKAKVLKGKVNMNLNYSLTDQEVAEGYILTCQAHPASEEVTISYDA